MKILIIEDAVEVARVFESVFVAAGHEVVCVVGFLGLSPPIAIGVDKQPLPLDFSRFDFAFCDGQLEDKDGKVDKQIEGKDVVRRLVACNVTCFGMSTIGSFNDAMCEAGALLALNKVIMMMAVLSGRIDIATATEQAQSLRGQEQQLQNELFSDRALVERSNELIMGFRNA